MLTRQKVLSPVSLGEDDFRRRRNGSVCGGQRRREEEKQQDGENVGRKDVPTSSLSLSPHSGRVVRGRLTPTCPSFRAPAPRTTTTTTEGGRESVAAFRARAFPVLVLCFN